MFKTKSSKRIMVSLSMALVLLLGVVGTASAAEFPKGDSIPANTTVEDDVFISGDEVVIDGTVNGILFATGKTVILNGTVNGDAFLAGETIIVNDSAVVDGNIAVGAGEITMSGSVSGSMFGGSAAMDVTKSASIGRNVYFGGFSLVTTSGSTIGKDLFSGSYQSLLSGSVGRDLNVGAGAVELSGSVGRNAYIDVGDVDASAEGIEWMEYNPSLSRYISDVVNPGLRIADGAQISGKLTYVSSIDQSSEFKGLSAESIVYQTPVPAEQGGKASQYAQKDVKPFQKDFYGMVWGASVLRMARNFLKLMAVGALALWLLWKPFNAVVTAAYQQPMKAIGWGFLILAAGFLAVFIVPMVFIMAGVLIGFISLGSLLYLWFGIVGLVLTLAGALFLFFVMTLSKLAVSYMLGKWVMKSLFKDKENSKWLNLLVGVFLFVLIRAIPVVGWLAGFAATLIGMGAFWLALTKKKA